VFRRLVHVLLIVLTLVVGAAAAAIIVSQTAWFRDWLRGYVVRQANAYLNGTLSIGRLGGNLFFGVELEDVGVSMDDGEVVAVKDLGVDYNIFDLVTKGLSVDRIRIDRAVLYLRREGDTWSLARLVKGPSSDEAGPSRPIAIDDISVSNGSIVVEGPVGTSGLDVPKRIDRIDARFDFKYEPSRYALHIAHVSFRGSEPAISMNALSGGVAVVDDTLHVRRLALRTAESSLSVDGTVRQYRTRPVFKLRVSSDKLSLPEIAHVVPALSGIRLQPAFELTTAGPLDRLQLDANLRSSAGQITAVVLAGVTSPGQWVKGDVTARHLNLAPILNKRSVASDITARAAVDLSARALSDPSSLRGEVSLDAPRAALAGYVADRIVARAKLDARRIGVDVFATAYGAEATARGDLTIPSSGRRAPADDRADRAAEPPLTFDLQGDVRNVDIAELPPALKLPPARTRIGAGYRVAGAVSSGGGTAGARINAAATFVESRVAGATVAPGTTVGVQVRGADVAYSADATVANLDLQRLAHDFNLARLDTPAYRTDLNAHVTAGGRGTRPDQMTLSAKGALTNSGLMGGRLPQFAFDASLADDVAHVKADGTFADFDPAAASGKAAMKGRMGGHVTLDATVSSLSQGVTLDSVRASAKLTLQPSEIGGLAITRASVDGDYHNATADLRTLEIVGRDLNVQASGTLALNDDAQSNLKLRADSPSLATLGSLVNRPLTGMAKLDATITGNRRELRAAGNVTGDGVKYGGNGALALSTNYTAAVPDLDPAKATATAYTHGTFVTLAGENINELQARTDYANKELRFDAMAKQPQRSLTAGGSFLMHPDHQEVHLHRLSLQSQNVSWQIAPGTQPAFQYGNDAISVSDLRLVSAGGQQITADGTFGRPGDALKISFDNIAVATVDALLLRPPQLGGVLNASATIAGTKTAPRVDARFDVEQGSFRQFQYESFRGTVGYGGRGIRLDTRLQQNPFTWIEAKGYVPTAALGRAAANLSRAHVEPASAEDSFDLHVDSSPIDLGLVQGFTNAVTKASGTVQAKVDVTGAAADPHPAGTVIVRNGAFHVPATGVDYTNLDGRIDLLQDRVHVGAITVLDNHENPLNISGDLALHGDRRGGVEVYVHSDDFKVIDNEMGNVRVNTDLALTGELRAPRIEGAFGITTGRLDLDPIIAKAGVSAYATKETEFAATPADTEGQKNPAPAGFGAVGIDVHVTVPDDLAVRATDLRAPGAPVGLGTMNITLGGDLRITKQPGQGIRLVGPVNTVRGYYDFQGRRFTILRDGSVRFEGLEQIDPALDIRSERVIQGVAARVNVVGTLRKPELKLSSTPPLEEADILSLIVFNQPINTLGEGQQISLAQRAEAMAAGALAGELSRSIEGVLNLSEFQINAAPASGGGPEVTIGEQIGQNFYVRVEQGFGSQAQTNVVFEYEITRWLRLRTNVFEGSQTTQQQMFQPLQDTGIDLLFFFSF
jgi:autotransporter translocation and assembly factor TamB